MYKDKKSLIVFYCYHFTILVSSSFHKSRVISSDLEMASSFHKIKYSERYICYI